MLAFLMGQASPVTQGVDAGYASRQRSPATLSAKPKLLTCLEAAAKPFGCSLAAAPSQLQCLALAAVVCCPEASSSAG